MCKILIAEDNKITAKLISGIVKNIGDLYIKIAYTSQEEIEYLKEENFDLVIQDIQLMSDNDGWEIAEMIKDNPKIYGSPLLLFLTSMKGKEVRLKSFQSGGYDYIAKPWSEEHLFLKVKVMIEITRKLKKYKKVFKLKYKNISLETDNFIVKVGKKDIELTDMEYKLITLLIKAKGNVVAYKECIRNIYGDNNIFAIDLDKLYALKSHLHKKTGVIHTKKGEGYFL